MRRTLFILGALILIGIAGDFLSPYRTALIETVRIDAGGASEPAHFPALIGTDAHELLRVRSIATAYALGGQLAVRASGGRLFANVSGRDSALPLGPDDKDCSSADSSGIWTCHIPFRFENEAHIDLAAVTTTTVVGVHMSIVKSAPTVAIGIDSLFILFAVLSLGALLLLHLPFGGQTKASILATVGALWLLIFAGPGGFALLVVLAATFVMLRLQLAEPASVLRLGRTVALVIAVLLLGRLSPLLWHAVFADPGQLGLGVPLGFAFFVIRALDLAFRISTREVQRLSGRDYCAYMLFPATLTAGPILTLPQFQRAAIDRPTLVDWSAGLARIAVGLVKKVIADLILARLVVPRLMGLYADPLAVPVLDLWILLASNALYVFLDFSGYSDIAIGVGRQLGWRVPENFDFPLVRSSMRAFWRHWHITLSAWVARWVHFFTAFSLRRSGRWAQATLPVVVSLFVIGLWHEVQASWLLWGLHHASGVLLGDLAVVLAAPALAGMSESRVPRVTRFVGGMIFVWVWVSLSHCFTLVSDPLIALQVYGRALGLGW